MHILQITPQYPYPPDSGGRVSIYNYIRYISRHHKITLLSFVNEEAIPHIHGLEAYCENIYTVPVRVGTSMFSMLKNVVSSLPYTMEKFASDEMRETVRRVTASNGIDLVQIDHLHMAQYIEDIPSDLPVILREQNVETTIMKRLSQQARNPFVKTYSTLQARRLHRYEATFCEKFDRCVAITDVDRASLQHMAPNAKVETIVSGVDTEQFEPADFDIEPQPFRMVTTGDYGWLPTADGLTYLIRDIYPLIREKIPEATLSVVGRNPPSSATRMAQNNGIEILGRVEDVRPEILRGALFVVPTRIGSGIRLKILEAMALQRPVVSTSVGCEGIEAMPDEHILVADDPVSFADAVVRLLLHPDQAQKQAQKALQLIKDHYAWTAIAGQFCRLYETVKEERTMKCE